MSGLFEIGHSLKESKTFVPRFFKNPDLDYVYVDIAGLKDTSGPMFDIVNSFMNKIIFGKAKSIKILVPMSRHQISICKGQYVIEQMKLVLKLCTRNCLQ